MSTKSGMAVTSSFSLREYWYNLVLSSNFHVEGDKVMPDNNPVRLTFDSWCSLSDGKISIQVPTHYACVFIYINIVGLLFFSTIVILLIPKWRPINYSSV